MVHPKTVAIHIDRSDVSFQTAPRPEMPLFSLIRSGTVAVLVVAYALALFPVQLRAETYHVDQSRGSDDNPGTESKPFKTIKHVSTVLKAGDTAILHEGVYHEQIMGGA